MKRVKPGDGGALQPFRWWQLFSRSLFHLPLADGPAGPEVWSIDVRHGGDSNGVVIAQLYRNGRNEARSKVPARFPVTGGVIEVAASAYGLKRCRYVSVDGTQRQLDPDPRSAEGRRAALDRTHPVISRAIGAVSLAVVIVAFVLGVPQIVDQITHIPAVAERVGTFVSPVRLPEWANYGLLVGTVVASTERALRLRYNAILDGGIAGDE